MVDEVIYLAMISRQTCIIIKVDFEKACESVSWSFLHSIISRL